MFIIALDGSLENVTIETPNPLVEGKYISSGRGSNFHPTYKQHKRS
jgi:hypothetical protein